MFIAWLKAQEALRAVKHHLNTGESKSVHYRAPSIEGKQWAGGKPIHVAPATTHRKSIGHMPLFMDFVVGRTPDKKGIEFVLNETVVRVFSNRIEFLPTNSPSRNKTRALLASFGMYEDLIYRTEQLPIHTDWIRNGRTWRADQIRSNPMLVCRLNKYDSIASTSDIDTMVYRYKDASLHTTRPKDQHPIYSRAIKGYNHVDGRFAIRGTDEMLNPIELSYHLIDSVCAIVEMGMTRDDLMPPEGMRVGPVISADAWDVLPNNLLGQAIATIDVERAVYSLVTDIDTARRNGMLKSYVRTSVAAAVEHMLSYHGAMHSPRQLNTYSTLNVKHKNFPINCPFDAMRKPITVWQKTI